MNYVAVQAMRKQAWQESYSGTASMGRVTGGNMSQQQYNRTFGQRMRQRALGSRNRVPQLPNYKDPNMSVSDMQAADHALFNVAPANGATRQMGLWQKADGTIVDVRNEQARQYAAHQMQTNAPASGAVRNKDGYWTDPKGNVVDPTFYKPQEGIISGYDQMLDNAQKAPSRSGRPIRTFGWTRR